MNTWVRCSVRRFHFRRRPCLSSYQCRLTKRFPNTQQFGHHFAAGVVQIMAGFQRATDDEKEFKGRFTFVVHRGPFRVVLWFQQKQHGGDEIIGLAFEYAHPWDGVAVNETHGFNPQLGGQIPQHCKKGCNNTEKERPTHHKTTKKIDRFENIQQNNKTCENSDPDETRVVVHSNKHNKRNTYWRFH